MDTISYASDVVGRASLWLGILVGIAACVLVFRAAGKMGGGLFGGVLNLFGLGMIMVVLGTLSVVFVTFIPDGFSEVVRTVLFSLGYILMVLGANRLLKGIMS